MRRSEAEGSRAGEAERTSDSEVTPRRRALRAIRTVGAPRATAGNAGKCAEAKRRVAAQAKPSARAKRSDRKVPRTAHELNAESASCNHGHSTEQHCKRKSSLLLDRVICIKTAPPPRKEM